MVNETEPDAASRRTLLRLAGAGAAGLVVGCAGAASKPRTTHTVTAPASPDAAILNALLDLEHQAIAAYTAAAPLLRGSARLAAQRFLSQELAHAGELAGLIAEANGKPSKPRSSYDLGHPGSARALLRVLESLERAQVDAYSQAIPVLSSSGTRAAAAAIFANDAQHLAILRLELGQEPAPASIVPGPRP